MAPSTPLIHVNAIIANGPMSVSLKLLYYQGGSSPMKRLLGLLAGAGVFASCGGADAHTLHLDCKKISQVNVICRTVTTDGEVLRDVTVQLLDENDKLIGTGKTDAKGQYAFKAPSAEYNVIVEANRSHIASLSSEDIW